MKRIFVGYGQGFWFTSPAIALLADRLKPYGEVSLHSWTRFGYQTLNYVHQHGGSHVACVGYSLSASMLQWISERAGNDIALGVAIDPSKLFSSATWDEGLKAYVQTAPRFRKIVCFYNPHAWTFGGAKFIGPNVDLQTIDVPHLLAQALPVVWERTKEAVKNA